MGTQSRFWVFTKQLAENGNVAHEDLISGTEAALLEYAVWQLERAPTTGRLHYQGYVEFTKRVRISACHKLITECHFETRRGTAQQARDYCMKDDSRVEGPWELGTFVPQDDRGQGKRSDLLKVKDLIDGGATDMTICDEHFTSMARNYKFFAHYRMLKSPPRNFKSQVIVLIGETGIGKSKWARDNTRGDSGHGYFAFDGKWYDGYNGTDDVIFDDFTGWIEYNKLLRYLDAYSTKVECKSGVINFAPRRIVITSNIPEWEWYDYSKVRGSKLALERRLDYTFRFTGPPNVFAVEGYLGFDNIKDPYIDTETETEVAADLVTMSQSPTPAAATTTATDIQVAAQLVDLSIPPAVLRQAAQELEVGPDDVLDDTRFRDIIDSDHQQRVAVAEGAYWDDHQEELIEQDTAGSDLSSDGGRLTLKEVAERIRLYQGFDAFTEEEMNEESSKSARIRKRKRNNPFINDEAGCSE